MIPFPAADKRANQSRPPEEFARMVVDQNCALLIGRVKRWAPMEQRESGLHLRNGISVSGHYPFQTDISNVERFFAKRLPSQSGDAAIRSRRVERIVCNCEMSVEQETAMSM